MFQSGYAIGIQDSSTDIGFLLSLRSENIHVDVVDSHLYVTTENLKDFELFYSKLNKYVNSKVKAAPRLFQVLYTVKNLITKEKGKTK